ncbi:MAG: carbohydrate kinase family protein [Armatimonadota bacterium]|nr:carbohydrate kinase family protein [Armatimonadota bacterium]
MRHLKISTNSRRYRAMIGVGGIGTGSFFALSGNHTLGREESRGGRFIDRKDYCKLHIISHYVQTLLGSDFSVIPVGRVGNDEPGRRLHAEMEEAGLEMRYVEVSPGEQTLFSFCFIYPDGSGGNMTTDDSACSRVDSAFVAQAEPEFARFEGRGIALAAPEVPIEARRKLLEIGTAHCFFRAASFNSEEISEAMASGMLGLVDFLAINIDEALAATGSEPGNMNRDQIVDLAVQKLRSANPDILISITAGPHGSWSWDGAAINHLPIYKAGAQSTAGAGDAHFSGMIVGLTLGLPFAEAQHLGSLVGALSVTSPHTLNKDIRGDSLREFARQSQAALPESVRGLLEE